MRPYPARYPSLLSPRRDGMVQLSVERQWRRRHRPRPLLGANGLKTCLRATNSRGEARRPLQASPLLAVSPSASGSIGAALRQLVPRAQATSYHIVQSAPPITTAALPLGDLNVTSSGSRHSSACRHSPGAIGIARESHAGPGRRNSDRRDIHHAGPSGWRPSRRSPNSACPGGDGTPDAGECRLPAG